MGGIIIEGRSVLRFKGAIKDFEKAVMALSKIEDKFDSLKIDTVPLPEEVGVTIQARFSGSFSEFEGVVINMSDMLASLAIDTVPLPERFAIGTWPTPENPDISHSWIIRVSPAGKRI